ncbi:2-amino-4-hydroxy-6-hydroxymethyldihydropteridine diphosphokinase [Celeribacter litoreus]|uniref:2-amino-4-hydroxy-6- hydroxymethyldihydropteridine diphosphokinase n=1 Tax=Celeribacter litoreus TaxID=2876714 RepID=UPI001CC9376A|nr:2-amino-4-hydroxy-6-hydroxymethyldihydropteridine diphosphokinase [Celeribacter litoreus]MCA0042359.1 2-amino-4-hydroxy-6-hydroxymethyldihydropteridine diphosphokinase [Celeribacter litoreus]
MGQGAEKANLRRIFVAMGANLPSTAGEPIDTLRGAVAALQALGLHVSAVSRVFETPCFPEGAGPDYLNAALELQSDLPAETILSVLHEVEAQFGRVRETRWAGRSLDLDLLAVEDLIAPDREGVERWINMPLELQMKSAPDTLILPHPRIQDRAFMLIPFADVAPDWKHPLLGQTVQEMLDARPAGEKTGVKALDGVEIPLK